jgi:hypothetical protein
MKKNKVVSQKEITIDLPEVKDIPGQENIRPPRIREMEDVTIASDDEEGKGILDNLNNEGEEPVTFNGENNVSKAESKLLSDADFPTNGETADLDQLDLDDSDGEDLLDENGSPRDFGEDLDIPGTELDDEDEVIGSEDEENNGYSRPD